jgi:hypothetical protein
MTMEVPALSELYVDLLERALTGSIIEDPGFAPWLDPRNPIKYDEGVRLRGGDWPLRAVTMIGLTRLRHLGKLIRQVVSDRVPGDFIETGVWRGGACIYMRAMLAVLGADDRRVWVADSFKGLPPPSPALYPAETKDKLHTVDALRVSLNDVKANFAKFSMLDDRVCSWKAGSKIRCRRRRLRSSPSCGLTATCTSRRSIRSMRCTPKYRQAGSSLSTTIMRCLHANRPSTIFAISTTSRGR